MVREINHPFLPRFRGDNKKPSAKTEGCFKTEGRYRLFPLDDQCHPKHYKINMIVFSLHVDTTQNTMVRKPGAELIVSPDAKRF
jgi:DNA polymerase II large subunit